MTRVRSNVRPRPEEFTGRHQVDSGVAELVPDRAHPGGWSVLVNDVPSSYVRIGDPTWLDFEYMQWAGQVVDAVAVAGMPVAAVHIGGAACVLPAYVAATRPGSKQTVFEIDGALVTLMRQAFGLRAVPGLRIRTGDGRAGLGLLPDGSADVVIRDAFSGAVVPAELTTVEFYAAAARVLSPAGIFVGNIADTATARESRTEAATAREVFGEVALIGEPSQLRGRRYGNVVLLASAVPLPEETLVRRLAGGAVRARYVPPARVAQLVAGTAPHHDPPMLTGDNSR